jgi:PKD repeat protein
MFWLLACSMQAEKDDSAIEAEEVTPAYAETAPHRYTEINTEFMVDAGESIGVDFLWDFGDGNQAQGLTATHTYTEPGIYPVVLTSVGSNGLRNSTTRKITAHNPLTSTLPQTSTTITIHNNDIWSIFPEAGTLHRFTTQSQEQETFDVCTDPRQLIASDEYIAITCFDSLTIFHIPTGEIENISLPIGSSPYGITGRNDDWWVTLSVTGALAHWDGEALSTVPMGTDLRALTQIDNHLYAPRWRSASSSAEFYHYSSNGSEMHTLAIDESGDSDNTTGGIPNLLESVTSSPDGTQFFIPMLHANILVGDHRSGTPLKHDNTVRAMLAKIQPNLEENIEERKHFDEKGRSNAVVFSPFGDRIYVLHPGVQNVSVLNAYTSQFLGSLHQTGVGASGLAVSSEQIVVNSWLTRQIKVYENQSPYSLLWEQSFDAIDPLPPQELLGKQIFHDAADTRITKVGYISCAHCHPNADHDGQTWDFTDRGEGLRNTTSLIARGGTDMGRLHWSGNFDELQDFEHDMREQFGGSGFLSDEAYAQHIDPLGLPKAGLSPELDALAAYAQSLVEAIPSPHNAPLGGEEAFLAAGCQECHPAPLYTDSNIDTEIRHDIGTLTPASGNRLGMPLDGIDTPSLIGVWSSTPYLHDGSVTSIADAIQAHVGLQDLSEEDVNLIIGFVQSL